MSRARFEKRKIENKRRDISLFSDRNRKLGEARNLLRALRNLLERNEPAI